MIFQYVWRVQKVEPFEVIAINKENATILKIPKSMSRLNSVLNMDLLPHYVEN